MKFKKVLAGFTAAALAVGSLSLISWAADEDSKKNYLIAVPKEDGSGNENIALIDTNQAGTFAEGDLTDVTSIKVVATISAPEDAYLEWVNGYIYAMDYNAWDWNEKKFGGTDCEGASWFGDGIVLSAGEQKEAAFTVENIASGFVIGYSVNSSKVFVLDSIKVLNAENDELIKEFTTFKALDDLNPSDEEDTSDESDDSSEPEENEPGEVTAPANFIDSTGKAAIVAGEDGVTFSHYSWNLAESLNEGKTIADIKKIKVIFSDESVADMTTNGAGGGLVFITKDSVWATNQKQWDNDMLDTETKSVTYTVEDDVVIEETAVINMQKWWNETVLVEIVKLEILDSTDAVIGTIENEEGDEPDDPVVPDSIPAIVKFYTQGNENGGWAWVDNGDTEYTITSDSDAIDLKWEPIAVDPKVTDADGFGAGGIQIAFNEDTELALVGTKLNVEITDIMLDGNAIDDIVGEYTIAANWNSTATEIQIPLSFITFDAVGKDLSAKVKITTVSAETPDDTSSSDDTSEPEESKPVIDYGSGNFVVSGGSSNQPSDTTADESKPAETAGDTSAENQPADTAKPADDTTDNGDDSSSAPSQTPDAAEGTQAPAAGNTNGDSNANNADKNQNTGVVLAFIPAIAAAAGVVIAKKRK